MMIALVVLVSVAQPSRRGSLLLRGLAEGPTSRTALLSYGLALVGVCFAVLLGRTHMALRVGGNGHLVLDHQGMLRRDVLPLRPGDQVRLVAGPAGRAIILDPEGRLTLVVGSFARFWRRDDVRVLLEREGVDVRHEHRLNTASEIEAAFPGSTTWAERSKVRLYAIIVTATVAVMFFVAWFLEF